MAPGQKPLENLWGPLALAAATLAGYGRTLRYPFVYDDERAIVRNSSLLRWSSAWHPPPEATVSGRPVLNLSFAANHAWGGLAVSGYHATNVTIHWLTAVLLGALVGSVLDRRHIPRGRWLGWTIALLWLVHPLQTAAITSLSQRAESLMALCYVATLGCFWRGASLAGGQRVGWLAASVITCALGMGTKEVMVSAPLAVGLFDATFVTGSLRAAVRERKGYYLSLAATWLGLIALVASTHGRSGSVGFGHGISSWRYALTQAEAICHYLRLAVLPYPLVFDYGKALAAPDAPAWLALGFVAALVIATGWASVRRPAAGFLGLLFFALLAPSSSFLPIITEPRAEHRMYLPLACLVIAAILALRRRVGGAAIPAGLIAAAVLLPITIRRNEIYRSEESLWRDTVLHAPHNERAHYNLGCVLAAQSNHAPEAVAEFQTALQLDPDYAEARYNLGRVWQTLPGHRQDAITQYRAALRLKPDFAAVDCNLGTLLAAEPSTFPEAVSLFEAAVRSDPGLTEAHFDLAVALVQIPRRQAEGVAELRRAAALSPEDNSIRELLQELTGSVRP